MKEGLTLFQTLSEGMSLALRVVLLFVLWNRFVELIPKNGKRARHEIICLAVFLFVVSEIISVFYSGSLPLGRAIFFIMIMGYAAFRMKDSIKETLFSLILYFNFRSLSYFAVDSLTTLIERPVMSKAFLSNDIEVYVGRWINALYVLTHLSFVVMIAGMMLPVLVFVQKRIKMSWSEVLYLSVMNFAGIALTRIMASISILRTDDGAFILNDAKPELLWQFPVIALLLYLGELAAILIWQRYDTFRQQGQLYYAENLEKEAIKKRLAETEDYYGQIRKVRHDMANHLMTIKGLADGDHNEELSRYISGIDADFEAVRLPLSTGSPVTDVVIGDKYRRMEEKHIGCDLAFSYDEDWGIPVYDISIILTNILDNAIEASEHLSEDKRHIDLRLTDKPNVILIRCENTCDPNRSHKHKRKDDYWHGIGLKNVEDIAKRFDGAMDISEGTGTFIISVMMKKRPFTTSD